MKKITSVLKCRLILKIVADDIIFFIVILQRKHELAFHVKTIHMKSNIIFSKKYKSNAL